MAEPGLRMDQESGRTVVFATGSWTLAQIGNLSALPSLPAGEALTLDASGIEALDPSGAFKLMNGLQGAGVQVSQLQVRGMPPGMLQVWKLVAEHFPLPQEARPKKPAGLLYQFGLGAVKTGEHVAGFTNFVGRLAAEMFHLAKGPGGFRYREFVAQMEAIFVYAIPISTAMIFLMGVVFAYLMGVQAQKFGANIYVVDGVAAAVLRELSPVIVAILIAGRSGAAITAQLGTMKVNEEIDALSVLGLSPYAVLVLPRILALFFALPLLVFLGDVAGLLGGMLVAKAQLGLEFSQYWDRLDSVLRMKTFLVGVGKAPVFAIFIGLIACRMGLSVARDARSVGLYTTSTVVQSIVAIIVINAIFAIIFTDLGI
jgi:phospholipid/cholesterol/gamma-HCH transport system permease protein